MSVINKNLEDAIDYYDLDVERPEGYLVTVLYGDMGSWKTTTACSMILDKGVLVNSDDSWKVLRNPRHRKIKDRTTLVKYDSIGQLDYIKYQEFDTAVFDPISDMIDRYLDLLLDKAKWSSGKGFRDTLSSDVPELKGASVLAPMDYRVTRDKLRPVIRKLLQTPIHVVFTSHVNSPMRGMSVTTTLKPALPDATWRLIGHRADIIGHMEADAKGNVTVKVKNDYYAIGKSRVEGIEGKMSVEDFVEAYQEQARLVH